MTSSLRRVAFSSMESLGYDIEYGNDYDNARVEVTSVDKLTVCHVYSECLEPVDGCCGAYDFSPRRTVRAICSRARKRPL